MYDLLITENNILVEVNVDEFGSCQEDIYVVSALYPVTSTEKEESIDKQVNFFHHLLKTKTIEQLLK